jgi:tetratricopeptide (TPR) repeat protein
MRGGLVKPPGRKAPVQGNQLWQLARLAYQDGRFETAQDLCKRLLDRAPRFAPALLLLGQVAAKTGRTDASIPLLQSALKADPHSLETHNELATLLRTTGRIADSIAVSEQTISLRSDDVTALNNLGLCYLAQRQYNASAASLERAIAAAPSIPGLHLNLGFVRQMQGQEARAAESYRSALSLAPDYAEAYARLGQVMLLQGQRDHALKNFDRAQTSTTRGTTEAAVRVAGIIAGAGQAERAEKLLRNVVVRDTTSSLAHLHLGRIQQQRGLFADAIANFEAALRLNPKLSSAWLGIVSCGRVTDPALVERMTAALRQYGSGPTDAADLYYALGKACDDLDDVASAMRHYDTANRIAEQRLRRSGSPINVARHNEAIDGLIAGYTKEFLTENSISSPDNELPILIVGMIRSGTTLVEQIISSHRAVGAGGELTFWGERAQNEVAALQGTLDSQSLNFLAQNYCALLHALAPDAVRVTDKMPINFMVLGLIRMAMPQARIIHCRRHPVDTCLSIYMTPYQRSPDFAHNRATIVAYYRSYEKLMTHWRNVLPPHRFFEVSYEDLVTNREKVTREMIAFCGLEWDDACLRPEQNARAVATPSVWQTRQPVYHSSLARWRRYERWLNEFRDLLREQNVERE